jgi:hypothetical protein
VFFFNECANMFEKNRLMHFSIYLFFIFLVFVPISIQARDQEDHATINSQTQAGCFLIYWGLLNQVQDFQNCFENKALGTTKGEFSNFGSAIFEFSA